jgi:glycosyltransferase EpsF
MLKVLHVITTLNRGGIERWLLSMLGEIPRTECAMDICCKGNSVGPYAPMAREFGANVYLEPLRVTQVGFLRGLRRLVTSGGYHIVHNHLQVYSWLPVFACRNLGVPVISSYHCTEFPSDTTLRLPVLSHLRDAYGKISVKYALDRSAMITGCSEGVLDSLRRTYGSSKGKSRQVLYYGTDLPPISSPQDRLEFRESFGWSEDTPIIVHIGRFAEQKNHFGLLRIFKLVLERHSGAKLLLIGGGPLRPAVEAMAKKLELSDAVRFLGYRDDVPLILSRADVFLFPSWLEGLGVAALEASAAAIPVVASKIPAISEAIADGVTGLLIDPHDNAAMADAVSCLLADKAFAERLGYAGRNRVAERFSNQVSADSLLRIYHESLGQHQCTVLDNPGRSVLGAF